MAQFHFDPKPLQAAIAAVPLAVALAACGDDVDTADPAATVSGMATSPEAMPSPSMGHHPGNHEPSHEHPADMDDIPPAPHATSVVGADLTEAKFSLLGGAPEGFQNAGGTVWVATADTGSTVSASLDGLIPGGPYMSHLHMESCAVSGGPHFKFDPAGPAEPPNEVHLMFASDSLGRAYESVHVDRDVSGAQSIVVHAGEQKLMCADLG